MAAKSVQAKRCELSRVDSCSLQRLFYDLRTHRLKVKDCLRSFILVSYGREMHPIKNLSFIREPTLSYTARKFLDNFLWRKMV